MTVKVACPNLDCGASYSLTPDLLGRKIACKKCGTKFRAIGETPAPEAVAPFGSLNPRAGGDPQPDLPSSFGRYRIVRKLGQGGMAAVYLAHDEKLDREVALKVPHFGPDSSPDVIDRFLREARAAAGFLHPNFCPIYDVGQVEDTHYLAMAFVEGETLSSLVSLDDPMPLREVASIVRQLALALAEAHRRGIIHRDLKPANVMVDPRGTLIIMDFGLARRVGAEDSDLTQTGVPLGTPSYMSPEQIRGNKDEIGPATDIYALGVILYELSTGRRPFEGSVMAIIGAVLHVEPLPLFSFRADLDNDFGAICLKAMAKSIEDRYPSMEALASALGDYLDRPEPVVSLRLRPPRSARKKPLLPAAGVFLAVLLGVIAYVATDRGTLRVEGWDPEMEIRVDGREVPVGPAGDPIEIRAGEYGLLITRGGTLIKAPKSFVVRRGRETVIPLEPVTVQPVAHLAPPPPVKEAKPDPPRVAESKPKPAASNEVPAPSMSPAEIANRAEQQRRIGELLASGRARLDGKSYDLALADYEEAIRIDPKCFEAYTQRGHIRVERGDLEAGFADIEKAIQLGPKYAPAYSERGDYWYTKKDYDKALADFEEAIRLDPKLAPPYNGRGCVWFTKRDYDKALGDMEESIRLDPKSGNSHNSRGFVWRTKGDLTKALADFELAIRLEPEAANAYRNLAWIKACCPNSKYRDAKRAVALATKACELTAWKDDRYIDVLAASHAEAGKFDEAIRREEEAMGLATGATKETYRSRLTLYRAKKPYRDPSLGPRPQSKP